MRAWTELKRRLNTEKVICRSILVNELYKNTKVNSITIYRYMDLLELSKYICMFHKDLRKDHPQVIAYYKLIKKIPEKLTVRDAEKMRDMPWFQWFKYPEELS